MKSSKGANKAHRFQGAHRRGSEREGDRERERETNGAPKMDTLPVELVDLILCSAKALVWPIVRCVCRAWYAIVSRRRPIKRFHENRAYKRRRFTPKVHEHCCTSPTVCAAFYMTRLIDAGHWALLD